MDDIQRRRDQAEQLLGNPVLMAAFEEIEARAIRDARAIPSWQGAIGDRKRRRLLEKANLVEELRGQLKAVILTGKQAARERPGVA